MHFFRQFYRCSSASCRTLLSKAVACSSACVSIPVNQSRHNESKSQRRNIDAEKCKLDFAETTLNWCDDCSLNNKTLLRPPHTENFADGRLELHTVCHRHRLPMRWRVVKKILFIRIPKRHRKDWPGLATLALAARLPLHALVRLLEVELAGAGPLWATEL